MSTELELTQRPGDPLERLRIAQDFRKYHHRALWEAEKHFSWLASVILSAAVLIGIANQIQLQIKIAITGILAVVGAAVCLIALSVLRRERDGFDRAAVTCVREYNFCFPYDEREIRPLQRPKSVFSAVWRVLSGRMNVREAFLLLFVLFFFLFSAVLAVSAYLLFA